MEKTKNKKIIISILALLGFITTIKLAMIYYDANFNPYALPSFCSVNEFVDCDGVAKTTESQFFGVPLAYWGLFLYSFIFLLLIADKIKKFFLFKFMEVFKNPLSYIAMLGIIAFAVSMCLLGVSLFEIKKLCILCAVTYVIDLLIALVAIDYKNGHVVKAFKDSVNDFMAAIKNKFYLAAFVIVMLAAIGGLYYTSTSYKFTPQVKQKKDFAEFVNAKTNKYAVNGNVLGDEDAKLVVYTYTDFNCPICEAYNIMIHKAAKELKGVKFVHKNLPLDMECNPFLKSPFHEGSCRMARYAMAAENQGKFWAINSKFFELHPNSDEEIIEIAKGLNLDIDRLQADANSQKIKDELAKDIEMAYSQGINGTPATKIGNDVTVGIKPYSELIKLLEDAGATKR